MCELLLLYIFFMQLLAVIITVKDKHSAKRGARRIRERTLMLTALLGGASSMYITMLLIRHKTKHIKFMFFLPLFIVLHIVLLYAVLKYQ